MTASAGVAVDEAVTVAVDGVVVAVVPVGDVGEVPPELPEPPPELVGVVVGLVTGLAVGTT